MPTFIVPVDGAWGTIVNFRSKNDYLQYVDIPNPIDINCITVKLKSPSVAAGLPPEYISNGSKYCMILEATRRCLSGASTYFYSSCPLPWAYTYKYSGCSVFPTPYIVGKTEHLPDMRPWPLLY